MAARFTIGDKVRVVVDGPSSAKGKVGIVVFVDGDLYGVAVPGHAAMAYEGDELEGVR